MRPTENPVGLVIPTWRWWHAGRWLTLPAWCQLLWRAPLSDCWQTAHSRSIPTARLQLRLRPRLRCCPPLTTASNWAPLAQQSGSLRLLRSVRPKQTHRARARTGHGGHGRHGQTSGRAAAMAEPCDADSDDWLSGGKATRALTRLTPDWEGGGSEGREGSSSSVGWWGG